MKFNRWLGGLVLPLVFTCTDPGTTPDLPAGAKWISLSSTNIFRGDPATVPGYELEQRRRSMAAGVDGALAKSAATIEFKEARVAVLNTFRADRYFHDINWANAQCMQLRSDYNCFHGRNLFRWDDLLEGLKRHIEWDVIYSGELKRSGNFVEGDIVVSPGWNYAIAFFIDSRDSIIWTSKGTYLYKPELLHKGEQHFESHHFTEGWQELYTGFPDSTAIWSAQAYRRSLIQGSSGQSIMAIQLPGFGIIGVSKAYAESYCIDTTLPPHTMRLVNASGTQFTFMNTAAISFGYNYYIDSTEVTQGAYQAVMKINPSAHNTGDLTMPVDSVSWHDAVRFCIRRSMRDGFQNCYDTITNPSNWSCDITRSGYRLPTEAEWEFAYRAGTATRYWWGDSINGDYCWYGVNSGAAAHPVAKKLPNAWRLYDMAGNLWEWVNDWCCQTPSNGAINVTGPPSGATRIVRGGQYGNYNNGTQDGTQCLTAAFRYFENPASRFRYTGFRCVRTAP